MDWEQRFCPNQGCVIDFWLAQQSPNKDALWHLSDRFGDGAFTTTHFGGRLVHLVRIAVLPAYRGKAIGVRLLADVVAYARSLGAESLTLNTQAHNAAAQRLYVWFGFRRTGEQQTVLRFDLASDAPREVV